MAGQLSDSDDASLFPRDVSDDTDALQKEIPVKTDSSEKNEGKELRMQKAIQLQLQERK